MVTGKGYENKLDWIKVWSGMNKFNMMSGYLYENLIMQIYDIS